MLGKRAQAGTEYIVVTAVILVIVAIIFGYSFVTQDQGIRTGQANTALDTLVNKADYVYALGQGNSQLAVIILPSGIASESMSLVHKCVDGEQGEGLAYCDTHDGIDFSAVKLTMDFFGSQTTITRRTRGPLSLVVDAQGNAFPCTQGSVFCQGRYRVRVYWQEGEENVFLQRVA